MWGYASLIKFLIELMILKFLMFRKYEDALFDCEFKINQMSDNSFIKFNTQYK